MNSLKTGEEPAEMKEFFSLPATQDAIKELVIKLSVGRDGVESRKASLLQTVLKIILGNARSFDENCQININWIGSSITNGLINALGDELVPKVLDDLYGSFYRVIVEFQLTIRDGISSDLASFLDYVDDEPSAFHPSAVREIQFARRQMPMLMLKQLISSPVLQNINSPHKIADDIDAKFSKWDKTLDAREQTAKELEEALKKYKTGFNFVGLHQGFNKLSGEKQNEVKGLNRLLIWFGLLAGTPLLAELMAVTFYFDRFEKLNTNFLIAGVPAFSLTLLLIYFFRIILRRSEAARSQLLQIELRKTLCEFIQGYADYAKEIRANNPDALVKFENMIFSGIVSSDEKLPTTFDGIDQISQLVQSVKGGK